MRLLLLSIFSLSAFSQIDLTRGSVQINLKYNGQPVTQSAPGFYVTVEFGSYSGGMFYDSRTFNDVTPGSYSMTVQVSPSSAVVMTIPLTVAAGPATVVNIELNTVAGIYFGKLLTNGQPGSALSCPSTGLGCIATDSAGIFKHLVAAGPGSGFLNGNSGQFLTYNFTVVAGQTVDLGTFTHSIGAVQVNLKYNGQPVTQAAPVT